MTNDADVQPAVAAEFLALAGLLQRDAAVERPKAGDDRPIGEQIVQAFRAKFASKGKSRSRHLPGSLKVVGNRLHHRTLERSRRRSGCSPRRGSYPPAPHPSDGARTPLAPQPNP